MICSRRSALPKTRQLGSMALYFTAVRHFHITLRSNAAHLGSDGEWISEVIDDKLYLNNADFHDSYFAKYDWLPMDTPNADEEYRKVMQSGSRALYFAQCRDQNETWLPLLEKAYAKAHGDYAAISGGFVG